ncbi:MAG: hypothetical protein WC780_15740 [Lentimicrobiaceae bacterium]|jgi:hypothetical protein
MKKEKLNLINLEKNEICKENLKNVNGGTVCAACWSDYEANGKQGGYSAEQSYNASRTSGQFITWAIFYAAFTLATQ